MRRVRHSPVPLCIEHASCSFPCSLELCFSFFGQGQPCSMSSLGSMSFAAGHERLGPAGTGLGWGCFIGKSLFRLVGRHLPPLPP